MVAAPPLRTFIADTDCGFGLAGIRDPPLVSWGAWRFRSASWILVFASSTICCVDNCIESVVVGLYCNNSRSVVVGERVIVSCFFGGGCVFISDDFLFGFSGEGVWIGGNNFRWGDDCVIWMLPGLFPSG